jgi:hypothetical protein
VVAAIGRWGVRSPWRSEEDAIGVDGLMVSFRTMFDPEAAGDLEARYEVVLGRSGLRARGGGREHPGLPRRAADPDARIETDVETLGALVYEGGDLDEALRSGDVEIEGRQVGRGTLVGPLPAAGARPQTDGYSARVNQSPSPGSGARGTSSLLRTSENPLSKKAGE